MNDAVLEVDDLRISSTRRGLEVPIVTGVAFALSAGEVVALVGESGSGKSLTGLAVMDLLPRGVVRVGGGVTVAGVPTIVDGTTHVSDPRRDLGIIFQNPMTSLNPSHRVGAQIAESVRLRNPGTSRKAAWERAVELLEMVEIRDAARRARQYPHEFSGGMRQRVMIAIALGGNPRVLVADEPTTALDVTVQRSVMSLIDKLRAELGLAVVLISHDLALVSGRSDRVLVMYAGEIVESGPTRAVLESPRHPYVNGLLQCVPERVLATGTLAPLRGRVPRPSEYGEGCRFAPRCPFVADACIAAHPESTASVAGEVRCVRDGELEFGSDRQVTAEATP